MLGFVAGMGGVGTTTASENCGIALAQRGRRVVFVDASGAMRSPAPDRLPTLVDHIEGRVELAATLRGTDGALRRVVAGNLAALALATDPQRWGEVGAALDALRDLADVVILDTGSAQSPIANKLVAHSDHAVVITDGTAAAVADAYGAIKALAQGSFEHPLHLLVTRVASRDEAELVWHRLRGGTLRFLSRELNWLGLLPEDHQVRTATARAEPFYEAFPATVASEYLDRVVAALERYLPRPAGAACKLEA